MIVEYIVGLLATIGIIGYYIGFYWLIDKYKNKYTWLREFQLDEDSLGAILLIPILPIALIGTILVVIILIPLAIGTSILN